MQGLIADSFRFLLALSRMEFSVLLFIAAAIDFLATCVGWFLVSLVGAGICFCCLWISFPLVRMMFAL